MIFGGAGRKPPAREPMEMATTSEPRSLAWRKTTIRPGERGNVFFTLFGAVALIGMVGVATSTLMRGPVGTVVQLNQRAQADSQMQIASKLAMLEASQLASDGDCDADGYVEPVGPKTTGCANKVTGGGCVPDSIGAAKTDPWGSAYGYCAWDHGPVFNDTCGKGLLRGENDSDEPVITIASAGPDRVFQTNCAGDPAYVSEGGDDIVLSINYAAAVEASGGLWVLKSNEPGTASIDKTIEVGGAATFQSGADFAGNVGLAPGSRLDLSAGSLLNLPTETTSGACLGNEANTGIIRVDTSRNDGKQILQICDPVETTDADRWVDVGATASIAEGDPGEIQFNSGDSLNASPELYWDDVNKRLGIGTSSPSTSLHVAGDARIAGDLTADGSLNINGDDADVVGTVFSSSGVNTPGNLDTGGDLTVAGSAVIDNNTTVDGVLTVNGASADIVNTTFSSGGTSVSGTLAVSGLSTLGSLDVANDTSVGGVFNVSGAAHLAGATHVSNTLDVSGDTTIDGIVYVSRLHFSNSERIVAASQTGSLSVSVDGMVQIAAQGGVGINTANPDEDLDIDGQLRLRDTTAAVQGNTCTGGGAGADFQSGTIAFSSSADQLMICSGDSSTWETIGTTGGGGGGLGGEFERVGSLVRLREQAGTTDFVLGSTQLDHSAGNGTRLFFDVGKAALRAGSTTGTAWDSGNLGANSAAFGRDTTAGGAYSIAAGADSRATGEGSIAMGLDAEAQAHGSVALGESVSAGGANSVALGMGAHVDAGAANAMAIGLGPGTPAITAANALGIFMGDQSGVIHNTPNALLLAGGRLILDPTTGSPATHTTLSGALDVDINGDLGADTFCNEDGAFCFTAEQISAGTIGAPGNNGEVLFNSNDTIATSPLFIFNSGGNMAVGSTTVDGDLRLDVAGKVGAAAFCNADGSICESTDNIVGGTGPAPGADRQVVLNSGGYLAADSGLVYTADGRLGLGISVPSYPLHIAGDLGLANGSLRLTDGYGLAWGDSFWTGSDSADDLRAFTAGAERLRVDAVGRLGLGTTAPSEILHVSGNGLITGDLTVDGEVLDGDGNPVGVWTVDGNDIYYASGDGMVGIGASSPATPLHVYRADPSTANGIVGYFQRQGAGDVGISFSQAGVDAFAIVHKQSGGLGFYDNRHPLGAGTEVLTIDEAGNLGIGVADPGVELDIRGDEDTGSTTFESLLRFSGPSGSAGQLYRDAAGGSDYLGLEAFNQGNPTAKSAIVLQEFGGKVGIGTATPTAMLDVLGGAVRARRDNEQYLEIVDNDASGGFLRGRSRQNNKKPLHIDAVHDGSGSAAGTLAILLRTGHEDAPTEHMRVTETGYIGLGTSSPTERLHVAGSGLITGDLTVGGDVLGSDGNPVGLWTVAGADIYYDGGNVGIGLTSPGARLDVNGATRLRGDVLIQGDAKILNKAGSNWITWADRDTSGSEALVDLANLGTISASGPVSTAGELRSTSANQLRQVYGDYGLIHRQDGVDYYMLYTDSGDPYGGWNALRPLRINNATGDVFLGNGALSVAHGGDVETTGSVGIGKAPTNTLDVDGGASFDTGAADQDFVVVDNDKGSVSNAIWYDHSAGKVYLGNTGASGSAREVHVRGGLEVDSNAIFDGRVLAVGGGQPSSSGMATATGSLGGFEARAQGSGGSAGAAFVTFHRPGAYATYLGLDTDNQLKVGGWSMGANAYRLWHENNDGPGSGLDADTIDGINSTNLGLWTKSGSNAYYDTGNIAIGGTDPTNKLTLTGIGDVTGANAGGGLLIEDSAGDATGLKLRIDANEMQAANGNSAANFLINAFGGAVITGADLRVGGDIDFGANHAIRGSDSYLRLNQDGDFASGVYTPSVLRADGGFNVDGTTVISSNGRTHSFGNADQYIYGDQGAAVYLNNNHSTVTRLIMRDKESVNYGSLYGDGNGANFGLLDGDGNWSYHAVKDSYTAFRINNSEKMRIESGGDVGIGTTNPAQKLEVAGNIKVDGAIIAPMGTLRDNGGGWIRTYGDTGWFNGTHGGGWTMQDSTWIRTYGNKSIYHNTGIMRTDGTLQVGNNGGTLSVGNGGNLAYRTNVIFANTAGNVGIGTASPGAKLHVVGDMKYSGLLTDVSDRRLKTDIQPLGLRGSMLEKLARIDTYSFRMKDDEKAQIEFGVMAQELEEVFPELVQTADDAMGTKSVNYTGLIGPAIEATKELKAINEALGEEIGSLRAERAKMLVKVQELREDIRSLKAHTGYGADWQEVQGSMGLYLLLFLVMGSLGTFFVTRCSLPRNRAVLLLVRLFRM